MKYRNRVRSRISNLKDPRNPGLRRNVLSGAISAGLIAKMTAEEMASDELRELRNAMTQEAIREHQMAKTGGTTTDLFQCSKCKKKNCTYNQVWWRRLQGQRGGDPEREGESSGKIQSGGGLQIEGQVLVTSMMHLWLPENAPLHLQAPKIVSVRLGQHVLAGSEASIRGIRLTGHRTVETQLVGKVYSNIKLSSLM